MSGGSARRPTRRRAGITSGASGTRVPQRGNWAVFDRTWYGRVLVERIEGFCTKDGMAARLPRDQRVRAHPGRRRRAHRQAARPCQRGGAGKRMIKRLENPHKRYKVGPEDFRNIAKRKQYLEAYNDMLDKTDTEHAPWHVIATRRQAACAARRPEDHGRGAEPRHEDHAAGARSGSRARGAQAVGLEAERRQVSSPSRVFAGWWVVAGAFVVHAHGLHGGLFLRRLLRPARSRVRRPARRDLAGLLDLGLPLFPARPAGRPDRRPARAAPGRGRRPAGDRARAGGRGGGRRAVAGLLGYSLGVGLGVGLSYVPSVAAVQRWFVAAAVPRAGLPWPESVSAP